MVSDMLNHILKANLYCVCTRRSGLAVGSEHHGDLVRDDVLDIFAAVADVLSGIKVVGMRHEVLADTGCRGDPSRY